MLAYTLTRARIYMLKNKALKLEMGKDFPGRDEQIEILREEAARLELSLKDQ